ncbi:hypothetical protein EB796_005503 [Bugula neritina]|uniref:Uncharacterized protein n=1 Tax=Bugula neritina TaxID=10212 RepID=A0A7J7KC27_BUGNE|nr:hypothetical protein EB796_005503 [Bugula neritina]
MRVVCLVLLAAFLTANLFSTSSYAGIIGEISFRNYTRSERSTIARVFWLQRLGWYSALRARPELNHYEGKRTHFRFEDLG